MSTAAYPAKPAAGAVADTDLLDLVQESLVVFGLDGRVTRWNRASEHIYGWSRQEAEGRLFEELLGGRHWPDDVQMQRLGQGRPCSMELHRTSANGDALVICAQLSLRHGALGEPLELVETGIDVTAQRRAEFAAEAGQRHYRNVFQAIPAAIWDIDFSQGRALALSWLGGSPEGAARLFAEEPARVRELMRATFVRDVNEQAQQLFGPHQHDVFLGDIDRYWPQSSTADFAAWAVSALSGETFFSCETRQRRYDGEEFDVLFTASFAPGTVEDGRLVVTIVDYTDIKRGQAAVRKSEAFYADLFHGSAFSAWHLDGSGAQSIYADLRAQGVSDFRAHVADHPDVVVQVMDAIKVVDINDTTLGLFGATDRSQIVGQSIRPFWIPDQLDALIGSLEASYHQRPIFKSLTRMRTLTGGEIDVLFTRSASGAVRSAGQLLLAVVDISDRVQAQNALSEMQATLAHAFRVSSLGELTASIAHEVNQPLSAIAANGEATLRWLQHAQPNIERIHTLTTEMISDARRASDVVSHIRSMASPQVGAHQRLSLSALVTEALALLSAQLKASGVPVTADLSACLSDISGDAIQLQQVVFNLVLNAVQAMEGRAGSRLILSTLADSEAVILTVEDNGPGVSQADQERLFTSFFTTKSDGMGIGLAICRTIAEAHGGTIGAETLLAGGARFTLRIPPIAENAETN